MTTLQWCHNGRDGVSNHQPHDRLLKRLFWRGSKKTSKLRVTGLCVGNSKPVTGEFPAQMASNTENVSIWWRHHEHRNLCYRPSQLKHHFLSEVSPQVLQYELLLTYIRVWINILCDLWCCTNWIWITFASYWCGEIQITHAIIIILWRTYTRHDVQYKLLSISIIIPRQTADHIFVLTLQTDVLEHLDVLVQDRRPSSVLAMKLRLSCAFLALTDQYLGFAIRVLLTNTIYLALEYVYVHRIVCFRMLSLHHALISTAVLLNHR